MRLEDALDLQLLRVGSASLPLRFRRFSPFHSSPSFHRPLISQSQPYLTFTSFPSIEKRPATFQLIWAKRVQQTRKRKETKSERMIGSAFPQGKSHSTIPRIPSCFPKIRTSLALSFSLNPHSRFSFLGRWTFDVSPPRPLPLSPSSLPFTLRTHTPFSSSAPSTYIHQSRLHSHSFQDPSPLRFPFDMFIPHVRASTSLLLPFLLLLALLAPQLAHARDSPHRILQKSAHKGIHRRASQWVAKGCYTDSSPRVLNSFFWEDSAMTIAKCTAKCQSLGYTLAGLEYSSKSSRSSEASWDWEGRGEGKRRRREERSSPQRFALSQLSAFAPHRSPALRRKSLLQSALLLVEVSLFFLSRSMAFFHRRT